MRPASDAPRRRRSDKEFSMIVEISGLTKATDVHDRIHRAIMDTHIAPSNAQARAGNYAKGRVTIHGLRISIETPPGALRHGNRLLYPYGYIRGTMGKDGDHVDVWIGPHPEADFAYVIDQARADGRFDEHKVVIGAISTQEAREIYLSGYEPGWDRIMSITPVSIARFKWWLDNHDVTYPFAESMDESITKAADCDRYACPKCGSRKTVLMPADFETAKCKKCGHTWQADEKTSRFYRTAHRNAPVLQSFGVEKSFIITGLSKRVDDGDKFTKPMGLAGGNPVLNSLQWRHGEHTGGIASGSHWLYPTGKMSSPIPGGNHEEAAAGVLQAHGIKHEPGAATSTLMKRSGAMLLQSRGDNARIHAGSGVTASQAHSAAQFAEHHISGGGAAEYLLHHHGAIKPCRSVQHMTAESLKAHLSKTPSAQPVSKAFAPISQDSYVPGTHDADPAAEIDREGLDPGLNASSLFGDDLTAGAV